MKFSGYQIKSCPYCKQLYKDRIVVSFNTFGLKTYSDGFVIGDWIPKSTNIIKCINQDCGRFFNLNDQKEIKKVSLEESKSPEWESAYHTSTCKLGKEELKEAVTTSFCDDQKNELMVRTLLNREFNHPLREDRKKQLPENDVKSQNENLEKLITLLKPDGSAGMKLTLAEYYREKGDFNDCIEVLNTVSCEKEHETTFKEKVYSQAKIRDEKVFDLEKVATKLEYRCDCCGESLILFNLKTMQNKDFEYTHYRCKNDNKVFSSNSKVKNPVAQYKLSFWKKILGKDKPYQKYIPNDKITCPVCAGNTVEVFNPENEQCLKCKSGNYKFAIWYNQC